MEIIFTKKQLESALQWILKCAKPNWEDGCIIQNPKMMQHAEFPEFLFLKYTKLKQDSGDNFSRTTNYTLVDKDGSSQSMSEVWSEKLVRMGIIADLMAFKIDNGKLVFE